MSFDIFRQGQRMAIKLIDKDFDGYSYYCYKAVDELRYIRCYGRRRQGCPATGKLVDGAPVLTIGHNHARNRLLHLQRIFQKELYKAVLIEPFQSFRLIYDHLCQRHSVAAVTLTWIKMEPVMLRWRKQVRSQHPSTPRNLMEYAAHLEIPQWQNLIRYGNGLLDVHTIAVADGSFITVISDINFLGLINPVTLLMDATFKIRPIKPKIYQVFSIIGIIDDTPLSICWILMTSKSSSAYTAGLTYFKDTLAPHIQPQTIITDFEASLRYSVNLTFPQAHNVGCYFHFCQALIKKLKQFDLFRLCKEWIPGQIIIRKFMALALLPHQDIVPAYNWLITNLPADIQQIFGMFIRYFRRYWLTTVKPIGFSVYNEKTRTNNFSEGNNRRNKLRFGIHPNIWSFT
ncbi:GSCOCG00012270001-RA-CDS, partial [Cotesia congregata]